MKSMILLSSLLFSFIGSFAQYPGGAGGGFANRLKGQNLNIGHFYGKLLDAKTNKPIEAASVQLRGGKFDTVTHQMKQVVLATVLTASNGDFSLEGLPLFGNFKLTISSIGYKKIEKQINFGIKFPQGGGNGGAPSSSGDQGEGNGSSRMQQLMGMADKDLGNIKIEADATDLANVTVVASKPQFEIGIDKKIFNVDKSLTSTGQTAVEVMKTIPSLSVDIDGNVTLRNASPTIFVDGRPTTMTLDQIPSDIIDKVEIITNPSAKYDASGGNAGILNIVLKKNKRTGYNGGIRAGIDSRGKLNGGGDINLRENKINFFLNAFYNQRKSISNSLTDRTNFGKVADTLTHTNDDATNNGAFGFVRGGLDYFIDNRNTISIAANYNKGHFNNDDTQRVDSLDGTKTLYSYNNRLTNTKADFENFGGQLSFKHNFAKNGHDITADANYNSSSTSNSSNYDTRNYSPNTTTPNFITNQLSTGDGYNHYLTIQSDYENPITDNTKFEAGARAALREFYSNNEQYIMVKPPINLVRLPGASSKYKFNDAVLAAYSNYSFKLSKWSFQLGLRIESSNYKGHLLDSAGGTIPNTEIKVNYPVSLFPSAFVSYKLTEKEDLQVNYSRRINRPNFFQLLPSYNFTDPNNPSVGNSGLKPEFTNSFELSYNNNYKRNSNFLATVYFKYSTDLITSYLYKDINRNQDPLHNNPSDSLYYSSYINANNSYSYGLELTNKMSLLKWWEITPNINFFNSQLNAAVPGQSVDNSILTWFAKLNTTFKLPKSISFQINGEWRSKSLQPQSGGGGFGGGGGGGGRGMGLFGGGQQTLAQGYIQPRYWDIDLAIRKDWTWKKGQTASLNLSVNDIFATKVRTHTDYISFNQNTERLRDPQVFRLNFTYRFGKFDISLFKRKNTKAEINGTSDAISGGAGGQ